MAAANSTLTDYGFLGIAKGTCDLENDTFDLVLLNTAVVTDFTLAELQAVHYMSEIAAYECNGIGYVAGFGGAGRQPIAGAALSIVSHVLKFICSVVTYLGYGADDVGFMALVRRGTSDADSLVVMFINNDDVEQDGSDLVYTPPAGGIFNIALPTV